jgi:S1-C subfamily serine protease
LDVVKGADAVTERLSFQRAERGRIVRTDAKTHLAVVPLDPDGAVAVTALGNSDTLSRRAPTSPRL